MVGFEWIDGFLIIFSLGVTAVGMMLGFTLVVYSVGVAHHFLTIPSDFTRRIEQDWHGANKGKKDHFEQGRILIASPRGMLAASVPGLITTVVIIAYLLSKPHLVIDVQTFAVGVASALLSLAATGFALGIYFGAAGKYRKPKNR